MKNLIYGVFVLFIISSCTIKPDETKIKNVNNVKISGFSQSDSWTMIVSGKTRSGKWDGKSKENIEQYRER